MATTNPGAIDSSCRSLTCSPISHLPSCPLFTPAGEAPKRLPIHCAPSRIIGWTSPGCTPLGPAAFAAVAGER